MKVILLTGILFFSAAAVSQKATAGPLDALKNFFVRPQPQHHVVHPVHHPKPEPEPGGPGGSPSTLVSPGPQPQDPQQGPSPGLNVLNNVNSQRPVIHPPPLYSFPPPPPHFTLSLIPG